MWPRRGWKLSTAPGGGYAVRSGTSMVAPYVSYLAALMMEEGIADGKRPLSVRGEIKGISAQNG